MTPTYAYTHTIEADLHPTAIWSLYEDVDTWPDWDAQAERITRDGPFAAGSTGTMKFHGQDLLIYRLTKVDPPREFVDETSAGALIVRVSHLLEPLASGRLQITYAAEIDGPRDQAEHVGPLITADFPQTMSALIALAQERSR